MKCQRNKFSLQRKISYLNGAYMSPLLKKVEKAGIKGMIKKRKPFHVAPSDFFKETEVLRNLFGQLINSPESARHVIIPSVVSSASKLRVRFDIFVLSGITSLEEF